MAGRKLENNLYQDAPWQDEIESKDLLKLGHDAIEYSNMGSTSASVIQAGSSIDIDGVIYVFDSNESISGTPVKDTYNYVVFYVSAGEAFAKYSAEYLSDYNYAKKGFYNGSTERLHMRFWYNASAEYSKREILVINPELDPVRFVSKYAAAELAALKNMSSQYADITGGGSGYLVIESHPQGNVSADGFVIALGCRDSTAVTDGFIYSRDGRTWSFVGSGSAALPYRTVVPTNGPHAYVGIGNTGAASANFTYTATIGGALSVSVLGISCTTGRALVWSELIGLYVVGGNAGALVTSPDGTTWTSRTSNTTEDFHDGAYGANTFVLVGDAGSIITSPDGITWTARTSGTTEDLQHIEFANGIFVVLGTNNTVCVSTDFGVTWTDSDAYLGVTISTVMSFTSGDNFFIASYLSGADSLIYYSLDGVTWYDLLVHEFTSIDKTMAGACFDSNGSSFIVMSAKNTGGKLYYDRSPRF